MLRLEYLFARFNHFLRSDDPELHHNAIAMLFDLGDIPENINIANLYVLLPPPVAEKMGGFNEFEDNKYGVDRFLVVLMLWIGMTGIICITIVVVNATAGTVLVEINLVIPAVMPVDLMIVCST